MSVRKHPTKGPGWWYIVVSQGRKQKPLYFPYFGTEDEVMAEDKRLNALIKGERLTAEATISDTLPAYAQYYRTIATPAIVSDMLSVMRRCLLPSFGRLSPRQLVPALVYQYHAQRLEAGVTHRTVEKECNYLSAMVKWMLKNGMAEKVHDVPRPVKALCRPQKIMMPLTLDELNRFLAEIPADRLPLALLMSDCGLRCQEALKMQCGDVDLAGSQIYVRGKGGKRLMYPILTKRLFDAIETAKAGRHDGPLVMNKKTGQPYKSLKTLFRLAANRAAISKPVTHHVLRHTFSKIIMDLDIPTEARRLLMRHSTLAATEHYTHTSPEWLERQAGRFADLIDNLQEIVKEVQPPTVVRHLRVVK